MDLKSQIKNDAKEALKSGDSLKRTVLGSLLTAITNKEIEGRSKGKEELSEEEIVVVIGSEAKKRRDAIEQFEKGGRDELAQKEKDELDILKSYLPEQLSEEEVEKEVDQAIKDLGVSEIKEMGKVVGQVMAKLKGKVDGSTVSRIVKEKLSNA